MRDELESSGFTLQCGALSARALQSLLRLVSDHDQSQPVHHRSGVAFAARGLLHKLPQLRHELATTGLDAVAALASDAALAPIDAIFLNKHARANWSVPGHQDRVMPVLPGSTGVQRTRDGVVYSEPSAALLARMVALRVHFDDAGEGAGALCVVPATHRRGVLSLEQIRAFPLDAYRACPVSAGDVLVMHPLLLHRSSPSTTDEPRRVLHVVYAPVA